jgi:flagellar basal-body rod modification protein FlgD
MSVGTVTSSTAATTSTSSATSSTTALDSSDFMSLLVDELQNQDPLNPTDTNQFMSQLMSYASYDQQSEINSELSSLVSSFSSMLSSSALGYLGHTVEATGSTTSLTDGSASWGYTLDSAASDVTLTVTDSSGDTVYTTSGDTSAGEHSFTWDGTTSDGTQETSGDYTLSITATDADGDAVTTSTTITGTVTGIDSSSGTAMLELGDVSVPFTSVVGVTS